MSRNASCLTNWCGHRKLRQLVICSTGSRVISSPMRLYAYGAAKECEVAHTITTAHARPVEHARTRRPLQTSPLCDGEFAAQAPYGSISGNALSIRSRSRFRRRSGPSPGGGRPARPGCATPPASASNPPYRAHARRAAEAIARTPTARRLDPVREIGCYRRLGKRARLCSVLSTSFGNRVQLP